MNSKTSKYVLMRVAKLRSKILIIDGHSVRYTKTDDVMRLLKEIL